MTYKDPKMGIVIDLSTEELPKAQKSSINTAKVCAWIMAPLGVIIFFGLLSYSLLLAFAAGILFWGTSLLCMWAAKRIKEVYYKARAEALEKAARGEIDLFDEDTFYGIIINSTEVGTDLLGWVRGVDQTDSLTPVSSRFTFTNKTGKEIKYITFGIRPYNGVGDPVKCTLNGFSLYECKCTGPFAANGKYTQELEHAWYNTSIVSVKIENVEIIYMDNSTETLDAKQIKCLPKEAVLSDNDSRIVRKTSGQALMVISGVLDIICIIGVFTMDSTVFSILTAIATIAFLIGLRMKT